MGGARQGRSDPRAAERIPDPPVTPRARAGTGGRRRPIEDVDHDMHRAIAEQDLLGELGWVRRLAGALARDEAGADDLVQDTWLAARDAGQRVPADGAARRRWLGGIVRNLARRRHRGDTRRAAREAAVARPEVDDVAHYVAHGATQSTTERAVHDEPSRGHDDVLARGALHRDVTAAVMALAEPYRSAVLLRYLDELSGPEVAARLGVSHAAARQRIARGLAALRADLDTRHGGERALWITALPPAWLVPPGSIAAPIAAPVPTLTTLALLLMPSKLIVSLVLVAAVLLALVLRARDGGLSELPSGPASPSVAAIEAAATNGSEAGAVARSRSLERVAAGPATGATLALVDENGAPRSGCVVLLRGRGGWRLLGHTDAGGHVAVGVSAADLLEPCELAVARGDLRATRLPVERAALTGTGDVTRLVVPRGSSVQGTLRFAGGAPSRAFALRLECDRALGSRDEDLELARALSEAGLAPDALHVDAEGGTFSFHGLAADWTGALVLPAGWRLAQRPAVGDATENGDALLLLAPHRGFELELLPPRAPLRLHGRVVAADSGAALMGAEVRTFVGAMDQRENGAVHTTTDERGAFTLEVAGPEGDDPSWRLALGVTFEGTTGLERVLGAEALPDDGDLGELRVARSALTTMLHAAEDTSTLDVRVIGASDGEPLGFALRVRAERTPFVVDAPELDVALSAAAESGSTDGTFSAAASGPFESLVTLESGEATLARLVPGVELELTATDEFVATLVTRRVVAPRAGGRALVELRVPDSARPAPRVGRVVDETGRALPRARVYVDAGRTVAMWDTDADGRFTLPFGEELAHALHMEVSRPGFVTYVVDELVLPAPGEVLEIVLQRGRELRVEVVDAAGRAVECNALLVIGARTMMPTESPDHGRMRFENAPRGAGEVRVALGGLEFTTPFDAAAREVRCVVPDTGTLVFTLDPARVDRDVLEGRVHLAVVLQSERAGASPSRARFAVAADGVLPREVTLVAGRYDVRLERRRGGAGLPRLEGRWDVGVIDVPPGARITRVVP